MGCVLNSKPLQRLKKISQDGANHYIEPVFNGDRFEHSFGAWYLAKHFDRPIEEQVASLLHDVPHTAFSHVVDFVMEDHNQEYHDRFLKQVVLASDIPEICAKHGLDIHKVLRKEEYYLLDNRTPELSFDRWDYTMRDAYMIGIAPLSLIREIINAAKIRNGHFYFEDVRMASQLCIMSMMVCQLIYVGALGNGAWFLLANALKIALRKGIVKEQDLFMTDEEVMAKLVAAHDSEIDSYLNRLKPGSNFKHAPKESAEFHGPNKARYIDPFVLVNGELKKTSDIVTGLRDYIDVFKENCRHTGVVQVSD